LGLNGLVCLWEYQGAIRKAILSLKYKFAFDIARELGLEISVILKNEFNPLPKKGYVAPIPVFKDRANWRGFNQSEEIGKFVAQGLKLQFISDLVIKKVRTQSQTELDRKERTKNLKNVFAFNPVYNIQHSIPIILFDDILTTGTTLKEATKALKRAGARQVWGLVLARS
jgi:ComF family protein